MSAIARRRHTRRATPKTQNPLLRRSGLDRGFIFLQKTVTRYGSICKTRVAARARRPPRRGPRPRAPPPNPTRRVATNTPQSHHDPPNPSSRRRKTPPARAQRQKPRPRKRKKHRAGMRSTTLKYCMGAGYGRPDHGRHREDVPRIKVTVVISRRLSTRGTPGPSCPSTSRASRK